MLKNEYIETLVLNKKMINIGIDDNGQCYFVEWVDDDGELKQEGCGTYNFNYKEYAEHKFGSPEIDCIYYSTQNSKSNCEYRNKFGYCYKCCYQDLNWSNFQKLIELGIIDRRGNVQAAYKEFIVKKENKDNA